jgi:hypothetical protein
MSRAVSHGGFGRANGRPIEWLRLRQLAAFHETGQTQGESQPGRKVDRLATAAGSALD